MRFWQRWRRPRPEGDDSQYTRLPSPEIQHERGLGKDALFESILQALREVTHAEMLADLSRVDAATLELVDQLKGKIYETSYAHQMVKMDAAELLKNVSSLPRARQLLYWSVRLAKPRFCVELGSAMGVSGMCIATALQRNRQGCLEGIEYEGWRAEVAQRSVQRFYRQSRIHQGRIEEVLPRLMNQHQGGIDFAFVDAVHKYEDTLGYHRLLGRYVNQGALVVYDDINWHADMLRFWQDLLKDPQVEEAMLVDQRWGLARYRQP